jgi:hypothetical protein
MDDLEQELDRLLPRDIIALCRARMAFLLGVATAGADATGKSGELAHWPSSPVFSERERACLAVAEQFVIDVTGIDQSHIDGLLEHFTVEETYAFISALWFTEGTLRLGLVLGVERPSAVREE